MLLVPLFALETVASRTAPLFVTVVASLVPSTHKSKLLPLLVTAT